MHKGRGRCAEVFFPSMRVYGPLILQRTIHTHACVHSKDMAIVSLFMRNLQFDEGPVARWWAQFFKADSLVFARVILHKHNFALLIKYCAFANYYGSAESF